MRQYANAAIQVVARIGVETQCVASAIVVNLKMRQYANVPIQVVDSDGIETQDFASGMVGQFINENIGNYSAATVV